MYNNIYSRFGNYTLKIQMYTYILILVESCYSYCRMIIMKIEIINFEKQTLYFNEPLLLLF